MAGIVKMARFTIRGAFLIEGVGALLLATRFVPRFGVLKGIYFPYFTLFPHFATPALT